VSLSVIGQTSSPLYVSFKHGFLEPPFGCTIVRTTLCLCFPQSSHTIRGPPLINPPHAISVPPRSRIRHLPPLLCPFLPPIQPPKPVQHIPPRPDHDALDVLVLPTRIHIAAVLGASFDEGAERGFVHDVGAAAGGEEEGEGGSWRAVGAGIVGGGRVVWEEIFKAVEWSDQADAVDARGPG
jgi:hypothetical protein